MQESVAKEKVKTKKVGNYIIADRIGSGAFGDVRLAMRTANNEKVAVKILEKSKIKTKKDLEFITREIKVLERMNHQNIVKFYEVIESSQNIYLFMEYVPNGSLLEKIQQSGCLQEQQAKHYFSQILSAVLYCHNLRIAHRDLKLENILIGDNQQLKIIDFGLSNVFVDEYKLKTLCGSILYQPPQMQNGEYYGPKADSWALGVILYSMVKGRFPFSQANNIDNLKNGASVEAEIGDWTGINSACKQLILRLLDVNETSRLSIQESLQSEWIATNNQYLIIQNQSQNQTFQTQDLGISINLKALKAVCLMYNYIDPNEILMQIQNKIFNQQTSMYNLVRQGEKYQDQQATTQEDQDKLMLALTNQYQNYKAMIQVKAAAQKEPDKEPKNSDKIE